MNTLKKLMSRMSFIKQSLYKPMDSILIGPDTFVEEELLHRVFEESIMQNRCLDKTALIYEDDDIPIRQTTYRELNKNANRFANVILRTILATGGKPNQNGDWIIAVCMSPSDDLVTTLLAVWKTGAAYVNIDSEYPQNRIEHIINDLKPVLVIYGDSHPNLEFFAPVSTIYFADLKHQATIRDTQNIPDRWMLTKAAADSKAVMLYTSGSSGITKGVRLSHHNLYHRMIWQLRFYPFEHFEDFCIAKSSLVFADHIAEICCPLFAGKTLIVAPKEVAKNPERLISILDNYKVRRIIGIPTLLQNCLLYMNMCENNKDKSMLRHLEMWVSTGEPLGMQVAQEFFSYFNQGFHCLLNFYGTSEVSCDVTTYELYSKQHLANFNRIPIGLPVDNTIIYVLDKDMKPVPFGEVGEICCAGALVSDGYVNSREPGSFIKNPMVERGPYSRMYKTGDFGYMMNGFLFYVGRRDTQIKIRGQRIDISEVELNLNLLGYVTKSVILAYHAGQTDQALVAFITTREPKTSADVEEDLKSRLVPYMIPNVKVIDQFPFLSSGKVNREKLLSIYEQTSVKNEKQADQMLDLQDVPKEKIFMARKLFETIGESLGNELRNKINVGANFFELGGNSMNCICTVTLLKKKGLVISLTEFLEAKNLGEILNKISTTTSNAPKPADMRITIRMPLIREPLSIEKRDQCIDLMSTCFYMKSDLDLFLPGISIEHYGEILSQMWDAAMRSGCSLIATSGSGDIVGVALNFDAADEPQVITSSPLIVTLDFLKAAEHPIVTKFKPSMGEVLHSMMMGTAEFLKSTENINVIAFMESETISLARAAGYKGILTTNTNPLTQQFGKTVFGYEILNDVQVNKYADTKGIRPFERAPDTQKITVMFKYLD